MKNNKKTNAARILDELHINYRLVEYQVDEEHLDAVHVAAEVGMPPEQVFKTLCVRGDKNGVMFAVIPGNGELDFDDEDREVLELISECEQNGACVVCVINKTDLAQKLNINEIEDKFKNIVKISANDDKSKYVLVDIINKLFVNCKKSY